jgi:D-3-phosphoglycerate dehydrogenase / 2-oxoglutarate reductase
MSKPVIAVADGAFADRAGIEKDFGDRAELRWADLSGPDAVRESTSGADALVVTLQRLPADIIMAFAPSVRAIGRAGVGLDTIDLRAAAGRGIAVFNQPAYGAPEVASHALALLLAVQRRLLTADAHVRGGWHGGADLGRIRALDDSTVGVLGAGRIGRAFIDRVRPLVHDVVAYDPQPVDLPPFAIRAADLDDLLKRSESLSLHLPLTQETRGLIGRRELLLLPPGAIVVNVSRGGIIDEDALAELLRSGHLGGAGLDVFDSEPLPADSPLLAAPNTVLTPHCASASERAAHRLSHWTIGDALEYLESGSVTHGAMVVDAGNGTNAAEEAGRGRG